jgi:hypothetical protein
VVKGGSELHGLPRNSSLGPVEPKNDKASASIINQMKYNWNVLSIKSEGEGFMTDLINQAYACNYCARLAIEKG